MHDRKEVAQHFWLDKEGAIAVIDLFWPIYRPWPQDRDTRVLQRK
jgi:hypothetical protein